MNIFKLSIRAMLVVACVALFAATVHAQYRASIQGVVTDTQGAVASGAAVTLHNEETGQEYKTTSGDDGIFNFNGLPPSKFTITVEKTGFKSKVIKGFGVLAEQANAVNVQLEVGQVTDSITVTGDEVPVLDTESASLGGSVRTEDIQRLPSFGRDAFQLLQLAPGAFGDGAQSAGGGTSNLPATTIGGTGGTDGVFKIENGGQITAGGARTGENNYTIDGVNTVSVTWGGTSVITPNEDSIKEVKVITDNYDAEYGRYRGAQVQIVSQNGTNQYHGSLFFKAHRPGLNAFTKYNGYSNGNVRDGSRFNDWGGTAGGPILHNRLFAFFSYETISNNAVQGSGGSWYETSQFRALAAAAPNAAKFFAFPGVAPNGGTIVDHDCAFIGLTDAAHVDANHPVANCNEIPGQGLDIGSALTAGVGTLDAAHGGCYHFDMTKNPPVCTELDYGTGGDGKGGTNNLRGIPGIAFYQGTLEPNLATHRQYNGRVDFNATKNDLIAVSFYYVPNTSTGQNGNGDRTMNRFNSGNKNRLGTAVWDHTFSPTLINEARVNAAGWLAKDLALNPNAPWGLPQVGFNGTGGITVTGYGIGSFNGFDQWTYATKDVLTKVHGAHTMKMGGEFSRLLSVDAPFWADRPGYTFNNIWDFLNDAPVQESAQSDPQTGVPSALRKDLRSKVVGLFFQDNYKVKPNLTVTAGLRWEYFGPVSEKNGKLGTVVLGTGAGLFTNLSVRTGGGQYNAQKGNFGPQLGFAWSPGGIYGHEFKSRLVIRGGIGIAFNGIAQSNTLDTRFNPPFVDNNPTFSGNKISYINSFPSNVHSPTGYAANPNAIVTFGSNNLPTTGTIDLTALPANFPSTYTYHYTLGGEYDLGHQWVASIGYQGSTTRHLTEHYNLYDVAAAHGIAFNPNVSGITYYADDGSARFNALLLELKHNFGHSFSLDTQYRLSHSMDSGSNAYAGGFYQYNLATGFATSDYDVRHAFKVFGIWSPKIFKGGNNWREKVAGGWSLSGILNAHTGFPWTPQYGLGELTGGFDPVYNFGKNAGGSSSDAGSGSVLPAVHLGGFTPNYHGTSNANGNAFFTPPNVSGGVLFECLFVTMVTANCPTGKVSLGPIPTAPGIARNSFRGPGYFDVDAELSKSFGLPRMKIIGEGAKIEIRANFYNLFNKVNLANLQTDIMQPHFGEAQNGLGARVIEMQARFSF
jgi:Carboxypeptidase regulatory-like domain/TonB dependent receptor